MEYPYDEKTFAEQLAVVSHERYERDEGHRLRLELSWGGSFPGSSRALAVVIGFEKGKEALLRNTLGFLTGHIGALYQTALEAMLTVFGPAGLGGETERGPVKTPADLHEARDEGNFLFRVQINLKDVKEDIAVFSIFTRLDDRYQGPGDGCEFVFDHEKLLFWGDGNTGEHVFDYAEPFWGGSDCEFRR